MKLKSSERKALRSLAHPLKPVVQVGKSGVSDSLIKMIRQALESHELIKVRFIEHKEQKKTLATEIAEKAKCEEVGMIGHVAIFFKPHPDQEKRKILLEKD